VGQDAELERWEITTAVIGLRGAYRRGMDAYDRGLIPNQEIAGVSVAEFVFWACALDERLGKPDPMAYAKRRNADEHGQVLLGLRYVRDRHLHQWPSRTHSSSPLKSRPSEYGTVGDRWTPSRGPLVAIRKPRFAGTTCRIQGTPRRPVACLGDGRRSRLPHPRSRSSGPQSYRTIRTGLANRT
jgi:hypothetical protein